MSRLPLWFLLLALAVAGVSCRPGGKSDKEKPDRAERDTKSLKEREAITTFARKLDELIQWRATPDSPVEPAAAAAAIASRLQSFPSDGLPEEIRRALSDSQGAWSALADVLAKQAPNNPEVQEQARLADEADGKLNRALAERGFPDVAL